MRKAAPAKAPMHAAMTVPMEMLSLPLDVEEPVKVEEPTEVVGAAAEEDVADARTVVLTTNGSESVAS